jgi:ankyrin repeat protein
VLLASTAGKNDVVEILLPLSAAKDRKQIAKPALGVKKQTNAEIAADLKLEEDRVSFFPVLQPQRQTRSWNPNDHENLSDVDERLFAAVETRDHRGIDAALAEGANPCAVRPTDKFSVLSCAVQKNSVWATKRLLKLGAKPEQSALCELGFAIRRGFEMTAVELIHAGTDPNEFSKADADANKLTPLMLASMRGHSEVVEALLTAGADPARRNTNGKTAAELAAESGHHHIVAKYLDGKLDGGYNTKLIAELRRTARIKGLHTAVEEGRLGEVRRFLAEGMDVNARAYVAGDSPLAEATRSRQREVMDYLLSVGADLNAKALNPPLYWAAMHDDEALVRDFLARGALVDGPPGAVSTPLAAASEAGHVAVTQILIDAGANVNALDLHKITVLVRARDFEVRHKRSNPAIPLLLAAGAKEQADPKVRRRGKK